MIASYRVLVLVPVFFLISCGQSQESTLEEYQSATWHPRSGAEVLRILASSSIGKSAQSYLYAEEPGVISLSTCAATLPCQDSLRKEDLSKMIGLISQAMVGAKYVDRQQKGNCGTIDYHVSVAANEGKFQIYTATCLPKDGLLIIRELANASARELVEWAKAQPMF